MSVEIQSANVSPATTITTIATAAAAATGQAPVAGRHRSQVTKHTPGAKVTINERMLVTSDLCPLPHPFASLPSFLSLTISLSLSRETMIICSEGSKTISSEGYKTIEVNVYVCMHTCMYIYIACMYACTMYA